MSAPPLDADEATRKREELKALLERLDVLETKKRKLDRHIQCLHTYNEIKDVAQTMLGKLAELEGVTTKDMYSKFGLELDD